MRTLFSSRIRGHLWGYCACNVVSLHYVPHQNLDRHRYPSRSLRRYSVSDARKTDAAYLCQRPFTNATAAVLSIITGGGKWVEIKIPADSLYQHLLLTAEKKFWRCVQSGERPRLFGVEPPRAHIEALRIVDMSASNAWAEFSSVFRRTREAHLEHENAKTELKGGDRAWD